MNIIEHLSVDAQALRFTGVDWFSQHIPVWEAHLAPLREREAHALEIGSYEGRSATWLAWNVLRHYSSSLTCIDPCDNGDVSANLRSNLSGTWFGKRASLIAGTSTDVLPGLLVNAA